ncbi:MAG: class I SAM-dependent methyltransferase [Desulfobacterales bacterium]|nr:class I SAM-dependent methyltransferase [Desulfobacterales bacterium]
MANKEKIFLFWGEDLPQFERGLLGVHHRAGETLLPVNAGAMQKARQDGLPFVLPEDWLGTEATLKARWAADDWEARWFVPAREALSSDGICWPGFDKEALNWYWRDLTLADRMVRACRERDVEKVSLVLNNPLRPALGYGRSDVPGLLIRAALGDRVVVRETGHDPWPAILSPAIALERLRKGRETVSPDRIAGRIVLALNPGEFHRFAPAIEELCQRFVNRVTVIALWPSPAETTALARSCPADVLTPGLAPAMDADLGKRFFGGYLQAAAAADGKDWAEALTLTRFQFEYYCGFRLPVLAVNFRAWSGLWQAHRPAMVITSSLPDSESQLPALAADRAGIPTLSLPHGGFGAREQDCHARTVLYNCEPTRQVYVAAGIGEQRLRSCRDVIGENEYPTASQRVLHSRKSWRILVLTNPVKFDACLFNTTMIGSQMAALEAMTDPPANLAGKVDLMIKTHPSRHDHPLFELAGGGLAEHVLPATVPLADALEQADLVIALNYLGTALIYALQARKPMVFFWNDPLLLRRSHSFRHAHLMLPAGERVETGRDLWQIVEQFFTNPAFAQRLRNRADVFARTHLDTSAYDSLSDIVGEMMTGNLISKEGSTPMTRRPATQPVESLFPGVSDLPVDMAGHIAEYGGMPPEELRILCAVIRARQPQTIFEIGTFKGGTTLRMAANSQAQITTLDLPAKGHRDHRLPEMNDPELDVYPDIPGIRFRGSPHARRIEQVLADSRTFDYSPYFGKMDLVFVDACHHHDFVIRDSMNAFKMRSPGGMIVWHDYADYAPGVMRALETVHGRFPLVHIAGTSLAVYMENNHDHEKAPEPQGVDVISKVAPEKDRPSAQSLLAAIAEDPGQADVLARLALEAAGESDLSGAREFLRDALILEPAHPQALSLKRSMEKERGVQM